jgi:hypothetical protein
MIEISADALRYGTTGNAEKSRGVIPEQTQQGA